MQNNTDNSQEKKLKKTRKHAYLNYGHTSCNIDLTNNYLQLDITVLKLGESVYASVCNRHLCHTVEASITEKKILRHLL